MSDGADSKRSAMNEIEQGLYRQAANGVAAAQAQMSTIVTTLLASRGVKQAQGVRTSDDGKTLIWDDISGGPGNAETGSDQHPESTEPGPELVRPPEGPGDEAEAPEEALRP